MSLVKCRKPALLHVTTEVHQRRVLDSLGKLMISVQRLSVVLTVRIQ